QATMRDAAVVAERRADRTSVEITLKILSQPPKLIVAWRPRVLAFILASLGLLTGCANSDFGEVNPVLVTDGIHDWIGCDRSLSADRASLRSPAMVFGRRRVRAHSFQHR
ncbi:MAG: hypothetical protein WCF55_16860, partial [Pseudolabrys sp.]